MREIFEGIAALGVLAIICIGVSLPFLIFFGLVKYLFF